jgi:hypothetical protein
MNSALTSNFEIIKYSELTSLFSPPSVAAKESETNEILPLLKKKFELIGKLDQLK